MAAFGLGPSGGGVGAPLSAHGWRIRELRQWPSGLPLPGRLGKAARMSPCLPADCCSRWTLGPARAHLIAQPPGEFGPAPLRVGAPGPLAPKGRSSSAQGGSANRPQTRGRGLCPSVLRSVGGDEPCTLREGIRRRSPQGQERARSTAPDAAGIVGGRPQTLSSRSGCCRHLGYIREQSADRPARSVQTINGECFKQRVIKYVKRREALRGKIKQGRGGDRSSCKF